MKIEVFQAEQSLTAANWFTRLFNISPKYCSYWPAHLAPWEGSTVPARPLQKPEEDFKTVPGITSGHNFKPRMYFKACSDGHTNRQRTQINWETGPCKPKQNMLFLSPVPNLKVQLAFHNIVICSVKHVFCRCTENKQGSGSCFGEII